MVKTIGNVQTDAQVRAVASGTLSNGDTIIVNSDGTVSAVGQTTISQVVGSEVVFESATTEYIQCAFDSSNNKVVIVYKDDANSNYGTAVVGTVSGNSISFGTPVVYESGQVRWQFPVFDSTNNKIVIAYRKDDDGGDGAAIVGTVSGTSISFGTSSEFEAGEVLSSAQPLTATFDSNSGKVVIAYVESSNSNYGMAIVGTVSGTSISFGSNVAFESSSSSQLASTFDTNSNKVVIFYKVSSTGKGIVGTVSGTSISFGSSANIGGNPNYTFGTFDSTNNKAIVVYQDGDNSSYGTAAVATVSGASISFGTPVVFRSKQCQLLGATFDSNANKVIVAYRNANTGENAGELVVGTVSGTSISFDSEVTFNSDNTRWISATFDSNANKVVIAYKDEGNSNYGTALVFQPSYQSTNLTAENFIGFADGAYADTQSAAINSTCSVDRSQTSLTAGQKYYVQGDGSLGLTAADPSVEAGIAISSTEILVKG